MEKKSKIVIIILAILVLGLGGYITYDKVFVGKCDKQATSSSKAKENKSTGNIIDDTNESQNVVDNDSSTENIVNDENNNDNPVTINTEKKNSISFDSSLDCRINMIPYISALLTDVVENDKINISKYDNKDEEAMKQGVLTYISRNIGKSGFGYTIKNSKVNSIPLQVITQKNSLDGILKTMYNVEGLKDYSYGDARYGIEKIEDSYYNVHWPSSGGGYVLENIELELGTKNVSYITGQIKTHGTNIGKIKVTVTQDELESCRITKIEEVK